MAGDAGEGTFGGADAGIAKIIRLIIASPVHLVRDGLAASLRGRADLIVVDVTDLRPRGIAKIADAQSDIVLVDWARRIPLQQRGRSRLSAVERDSWRLQSTRPTITSLPALPQASAAMSRA